ncbi:MAG: helix-turn-helix domain-containing protein [Chitinophagaceae bacterium]
MNATVLMVAAVQGLMLSVALITKRSNNRASNIYFSLILTLFSLELLFSWGGVTGYNNRDNAFPSWLLLSYLVLPPAIWFFFKHNTVIDFRFSPVHLLFFIPAILEITVGVLRRYATAPSVLSSAVIKLATSKAWFFYCEVLPLFATIIVLIIQAGRINAITKQFKAYSNPSVRRHIFKMHLVFSFFSILVLLWAVVTLFNNQLFIIVEAVFVAMFFVLGYVALFKPDLFEMPKLFLTKKKEPGEFPRYNDETEFLRLTSLFEHGKIYTRPKLTLKELSEELKLPGRYVSYLINTYACSGFNDFVNAYRVKEVLRRINNEKHKTLLGIAMDAGFNSKSTFNQVFKQVTGKSPSEYLV